MKTYRTGHPIIIITSSFFLLCLLSVYVIFWLSNTFVVQEFVLESFLILALALLILIPVVIDILRQKVDIFEPKYIVLFLYFVLFVVRPVNILMFNNFRFIDFVGADIKLMPKALLILIAGLIFFYLGYYAKIGKRLGLRIPSINKKPLSKKRTTIYSVSMMAFALVLYMAFIIQGVNFRESTAYLYYSLDLLGPAFLLLFMVRRKTLSSYLALTLLFLGILIFYFHLHARYRSFSLVVSLIIYYYLSENKRPNLLISTVLLVLLLAVFNVLRAFRGIWERTDLWANAVNALFSPKLFLDFVAGADTAMFDFFLLFIDKIPGKIPYLYGLGFLQILIHPIPRLIWPGKPMTPSAVFMNTILPKNFEHGTGFASSIMGDLYWNFGMFGIPLGMFILGVFLRAIYQRLKLKKTNSEVVLLYSVTLAFIPNYFRGEFVGSTVWYMAYLVPILIAFKICRRKALRHE